jgi:hypothetical protein
MNWTGTLYGNCLRSTVTKTTFYELKCFYPHTFRFAISLSPAAERIAAIKADDVRPVNPKWEVPEGVPFAILLLAWDLQDDAC